MAWKDESDVLLLTIAEWREAVAVGAFNEFDGSGRWVKDHSFMTNHQYDNVFGQAPEGATHVAWYNK